MTCARVCLGFLQITIRRARGCDHWPWGLWSHSESCSCFWVGFWGDFDSGSLDDTPVRELGGHSPKSPRVTTPLKQCRESGPMNRAVRTIRGRRTRSWRHCTERAATCCQSCGANPAGHARRTRWAVVEAVASLGHFGQQLGDVLQWSACGGVHTRREHSKGGFGGRSRKGRAVRGGADVSRANAVLSWCGGGGSAPHPRRLAASLHRMRRGGAASE